MLWACDRFHLDPDRAGQLDASVAGLRLAEQELKEMANG